MSGRVPEPIRIFHITHVRNLSSILLNKGLYSYTALHEHELGYMDIAHGSIQSKRAVTSVPVGPGGVLHDYVPFYFAARSPMLYAIHRGNVEQYKDGQVPIIHLASTVDEVEKFNLSYVFTDGHGIIRISKFFNRHLDFSNIDWDIMASSYWADDEEDNDRSRRRQAEFLVPHFVPWEAIMFIGTRDEVMAEQVRGVIKKGQHQPRVESRPAWYY